MKCKLLFRALVKLVMGLVWLGAMLFGTAGTWHYTQAWIFLAILFVPMTLVGMVLAVKNPALLSQRLDAKEKETEQRWVVALSGLLFVLSFVLAGFNFRYGWIVMPMWSVWVSAGVFLVAYALYAEVLRQNTYLSRTIQVQEGQQVISTGLYGVIRHPMYAATILLFLSMPLVLGSPVSFVLMLLYIPIIHVRIKNEEKILSEQLNGYTQYQQKVKYKVLPFVW